MSTFEFWGFWITVFVYVIGTAAVLIGLVFKRERFVDSSFIICFVGLAAHIFTIGARIVHTGHIPVASRYENILTGAAVVMLFNLILVVRRRNLKPLLVFVGPFALLMLGYALVNQPRYTTMSPVLDNLWMFVHIFFAWLAYGAYSVAAAVGVVQLISGRSRDTKVLDEKPTSSLLKRVPEAPVLDDLMFRFIIFGFVTHMIMIASGSIWARDLWGNYWSWDPVETWSLLSWLLYGIWIHLRLTLRWRGSRMAWMAIATLVTVLFAFWGTNLLGETSHSLNDLKLKAPVERADPIR